MNDIFLKYHQGNLTATVCGSDVERLSYDAWGRRRNTTDFSYGNVSCTFNRYAYCSHNPLRFTDPTGWYQQPGTYGINPNFNPGGHTTYHSDDPNDMLWGRTIHPCANSSSGCVNGNAVTRTEYAHESSRALLSME